MWLCGSGWLLVVVATSPVLLQGVVVVEVEDDRGWCCWLVTVDTSPCRLLCCSWVWLLWRMVEALDGCKLWFVFDCACGWLLIG